MKRWIICLTIGMFTVFEAYRIGYERGQMRCYDEVNEKLKILSYFRRHSKITRGALPHGGAVDGEWWSNLQDFHSQSMSKPEVATK